MKPTLKRNGSPVAADVLFSAMHFNGGVGVGATTKLVGRKHAADGAN